MRINQNTTISGTRVVLVPYKEIHVPRYNEFMQSEELQRLTASEPLTLADEYKMQKSWAEDEDKCTFILLDQKKLKESENEVLSMIGDTNLYIIDKESNEKTAEAAVMIADPEYRGKHYGWESMLLMLSYGIETLGIKKYLVKISTSNSASQKMFSKMQFTEESRSDAFQEITMTRLVDNDWLQWLRGELKSTTALSNLESCESG